MSIQSKNPAQNSRLTSQFMLMSGQFDPSVVGVKAPQGVLFIRLVTSPSLPLIYIKADDTNDFNWIVTSSFPNVFGTFAAPVTTNGVGTISFGGALATLNSIYLASTGGAVVAAGNPILPVPTINGQRLTIFGTSNVNTVELPSINGLDLNGGVSVILDANQALALEGYVGVGWREVSRRS